MVGAVVAGALNANLWVMANANGGGLIPGCDLKVR